MISLESVIEGCRNGDAAMQEELYRRYSPRYYALCRRYVPDDYLANEALVEGFLSVFKDIKGYRGDGSFEGWMTTVFVRTAYHLIKRDSRHTPLDDDHPDDDIGENRSIEHQIDIRDALTSALRKLTDGQRMIVNMIAIEGYTFVEASKMLEEPQSTTKSHYYKALELLKKDLNRKLGKHYLKK